MKSPKRCFVSSLFVNFSVSCAEALSCSPAITLIDRLILLMYFDGMSPEEIAVMLEDVALSQNVRNVVSVKCGPCWGHRGAPAKEQPTPEQPHGPCHHRHLHLIPMPSTQSQRAWKHSRTQMRNKFGIFVSVESRGWVYEQHGYSFKWKRQSRQTNRHK